MGAPKGNRNAEKAWFSSDGEEKSLKKYIRVTESEAAEVAEVLGNGETFSDLARVAIAAEVKRRKVAS